MNRIKTELINRTEKKGVVVLDDYIVEKYGKNIFGTEYHYDHSKGRNVWGLEVADCVFSGNGIYPLLSTVYVRKGSKWDRGFKTKIEIQMNHLSQLKEMNLNFSCVVMDSWYFCKTLISHIESLGKDWISECNGNRLVRSGKRWITLEEFGKKMLGKENFRVIEIGDDRYLMKAFTILMKGMGEVRILVSYNKHDNFKFYVTNRLDWREKKIAEMYSRRWGIEVGTGRARKTTG